jgi:hypothetical protein
MAVFSDVKTILDTIIAKWTAGNGAPPDLTVHSNNFLWDTSEHLRQATAKGFRLIQPEIVGQKGQGKTANIVVALTSNGGVNGFGQMPEGGLDSLNNEFLTLESPEIKTIIAWIEAGCPDSPVT